MSSTFTHTRHLAHERFKDAFWPYVSAAMIVSAIAHYVLISTANFGFIDGYTVEKSVELEQVVLQEQEFEIPPPPERISRPAIPVMSTDINISDKITIDEVTFSDTPFEGPPPPPAAVPVDVAEEPAFTPYEVRPRLSNPADVEKALISHYPPLLKRAGIGGVTVLWIFIDEIGEVLNTKVVTTSGFDELDDAAELAVRESARFTPALNRDIPVPVWIQMPITFATRG